MATTAPINMQQTGARFLRDGCHSYAVKSSPAAICQSFHLLDMDRSIEIDTQYEPEFEPTHPGRNDPVYQARRRAIASLSKDFQIGQPIPRVNYTDDEKNTWRIVFTQCSALFPTHMCDQYNGNFKNMLDSGLLTPDDIPQLEDMSKYLHEKTGFRLRPVGGLSSARSFLSSLAYRVFQCTQYVRHHCKPLHSVEPDVIHELLGHVTMFADPSFADFSQSIGLAALVASDDDIEKLARLYWFTVEFGLCRQGGDVRVYGAALASSYGEVQRALTQVHLHEPFTVQTVIDTSRAETNYQPKYFVAESFQDMERSLREFAQTLHGDHVTFKCTPDTVYVMRDGY